MYHIFRYRMYPQAPQFLTLNTGAHWMISQIPYRTPRKKLPRMLPMHLKLTTSLHPTQMKQLRKPLPVAEAARYDYITEWDQNKAYSNGDLVSYKSSQSADAVFYYAFRMFRLELPLQAVPIGVLSMTTPKPN